MLRWVNILTLFSICLFFSYCNENNEDPLPKPNPPLGALTISNLEYNPKAVPIEPQQLTFTISGSFNFINADGGPSKLRLTNSGGADLTIDIQPSTSETSGLISGHFEFLMPEHPISFTFDTWLVDAKGRASNKLSGTISVVLDDRMIYWKKVALQDATSVINRVEWKNSKFVAVGNNGLILTSPDAYTWTKQESGTNNDLYGLTFTGTQYIAVGEYSTILSSPDGNTWTKQYGSDSNEKLLGITSNNQRYVAVGRDSAQDKGIILTSSNGSDWTKNSFSLQGAELKNIAWSGSLFLIVGNKTMDPCCRTPKCICGFWPVIITSKDGNTWVDHSPVGTSMSGLHDVLWNGSKFLIAGGYYALSTLDGITWNQNSNYFSTYVYLNKITRKDQSYIGVGIGVGYDKDLIFTSTDGLIWSHNGWPIEQLNIPPNTLTDIVWTGEKYLVTGLPGYVLISPY